MSNDDLSNYLDPAPKSRRGNYDELINRHAQRTGLDPELVRAVVRQESGGNRRAVSPKGAQGLGQLMPATAKRFGVTDPFDPEQNIRGATDYLKFLNDRFKGNRDLVLAGYNAGEGAVDKFGGIPPYRETQNYVKSISARLGGRQSQQPQSDLDRYLDPSPSGQTQPASERQIPSQSPNPPAPPKQPPLSSVPSRSRQGGGIFGRREVQEAVRQGIRQPGPPPTGAGDLRRATRGDEARTQRLLELQREESRRESPTAGLRPSIDTRRATQRAARRLSTEETDITRRQRLEPEVSRLTEQYRKQIREAQNRGIGPEQWLNETAAKGVAGLLELGSGVIRGARLNPLAVGAESSADQIAAHAEALQRAAEAEGADRNYVSQATQNILAGTVSTAPEMVATSLGVPAPIAFGAGGATRSVGRGEQPEQVAKSGLHGAATGAVFEIPGAVGIRNPLAKVGTIGVGTGAVEAANGQSLSTAVEAGVTNALLAGAGEIGRGSRRQPSSLTRGLEREVPRERVEPDAEIAARLRGEHETTATIPEMATPERAGEGRVLREEAPAVPREPVLEQYLDTERPANERIDAPVVRPDRAGVEGALDEPQIQTKPPVEVQRAEVESAAGTPPAATESPVDAVPRRENISTGVSPESAPARFYHRDFGAVTESPNQRRVGKGRVRVIDESGAEHVIKRAAMTGRGNERAVPVREMPVEPSATPLAPVKPLPELRDNFRKPLREYADTLYRETSADSALDMLPTARRMTDVGDVYLSNTPDLALGQGRNKGILLEFDPAGLEGQVNRSKPAWEALYQQGQAEFIARYNRQGQYKDALRSVTVKPDLKMSRVERIQLDRALREMEDAGWTKTQTAEGVLYRRPEKPTAEPVPVPVPERIEEGGQQQPAATPLSDPVPEGYVRFYRVQHETGTKPSGTHWATDLPYIQQKYGSGGREAIWSRDVRKSDLDDWFNDWQTVPILTETDLNRLSSTRPPVLRKEADGGTVREVRVEGERQQVPPSGSSSGGTEGTPDSTTSARKAQLASDRAVLDLPELPPAERKSWQRSLSEARPETATRLADEVLNRPRALNDSETASLVVRAQQVKNEHAAKLKEIANATDDTAIQARRAELETLEREFDQLTQATKLSGTEKGRALAAQKLTINQDYDLVSLVARFKASAGRAPTAKERTRIEELSRRNAELEAKLTEANDRLANQRIQKEIDRTQRRSTRTETKAQLDAEWADLTKQFAEIRQREASFFKSEKGEFDPASLKLISRMVRNRVQAGVVNATQLVDDIHAIVGGDKRELRDAISSYRTQPAKQQSDLQRQLNALKSELRQLSSTEDVAAGRRAPRQEGPQAAFRRDEARQRALQKQITDLEGQMASGQFRERPTPEPPRYTAETLRLQKQLEDVRLDYERLKYRATASTTTRLGHEAVKAINSVKTLKSIGDISAVFRQGGFYGLSHPLEGLLKPSRAMLDSFTELGYRNVEAAIKADPAYDTLKRAGVEFTGVDPRHPHLSLREEGFLGGEYLDYIPGLKQVKNFSERTFVSFLDAQRLSMGKQMLDALTPEQRANPKELQSIAKLINAGTGRGNLGARGNSAAPVLNLVMFSPRLLASRVQLLNNMISPRKLATMPPGVRKRMIADNVKFLAATTLILGLAKAAGAGINLDPDDSDFLKIRAGNTTYDTLTGLQQPLRYFISMGRAIKADITGDETYAGQSKGELTGRFARSKLSPSAGTALDYVTGKDFMGRKFNVKTAAKELVMPLPAKDVIEAMQKEGLWGGAKATPTFVGIGVGNYPPPAERAGTHAEKLARRMVIRRLPDEARTQEEIDIDTKRSELRARARHGEDVSADIQALDTKITDRQAKAILAARNRTRLQEDVNRLGIKDALLVYSVANSQQRAELKSLLTRKADLVATLPPDEQAAVTQKLNEYGLSGRGVRISRPSRASRESRQSR